MTIYNLMPRTQMTDGKALGLKVGICEVTGAFVWWTTKGWYFELGEARN